ncbi:MAG: prepilin-type N-terminal cleavage/methylation domain-containing protein, partial [bacterium]
GFTLVEILVAMAILLLFLSIVGGLVWRGMIAYERGQTATQLQQTCRMAVDTVSADLRQAYMGTVAEDSSHPNGWKFMIKDPLYNTAQPTPEHPVQEPAIMCWLENNSLYRQVESGTPTVIASNITSFSISQQGNEKLWQVSVTVTVPKPGTQTTESLSLTENAELRSSEDWGALSQKNLGLPQVSLSSGGTSSGGTSSGGASSGGTSSGGTSSGGASSGGTSSGGTSSGGTSSGGSSSSGGPTPTPKPITTPDPLATPLPTPLFPTPTPFPTFTPFPTDQPTLPPTGETSSSSGGTNNSTRNTTAADLLNVARRTDRVVENFGRYNLNRFFETPLGSQAETTALDRFLASQNPTLRRVTSSVSSLASVGLGGLGIYDAYQGFSNGDAVAGWSGVANAASGIGSALSVAPSTINIGNTALNLSGVAGTFGGGLAVAPVLGGIGGAINIGVGGYQMYQGYEQQNGDLLVRGGLQTVQGGLAVASAVCFMSGVGAPVGAALLAASLVVAGAQLVYDLMPEAWRNTIASGALAATNYVVNGVRTVASAIGNAATSAFNSVRNTVSNVASTVRSTVSSVASAVRNTVSNVASAVRNTVSNVANAVRNTVSNVASAVRNTVSNVASAVRNTVSNVASAVRNTVSNVSRAVSNTVSNVSRAVSNTVSNVTSTLSRAASNVGNAVSNFFSGW